MLSVRDLWAGYPGHPPALEAVDLAVPVGEIVGLIGPNGAGKSTLIKTVLGLVKPMRGELRIFGRSIDEARGEVAYMPQIDEVDWAFPVSVTDVVLMGRYRGMRPFSRWSRTDRRLAAEALERMGLGGFGGRQVGRLSGGQRQALAIARALMLDPHLLLLDEASAALSPIMREQTFARIEAIAADGVAVLMIEQNATEALAISSRGYLLVGGQNALEQDAAEMLANPEVGRLFLGREEETADTGAAPPADA